MKRYRKIFEVVNTLKVEHYFLSIEKVIDVYRKILSVCQIYSK